MYRLIIADDEENIRNGMAHSLPWREWGYEVVALCASGQEVLDQMESARPDVVLSDIRMPGMDGVELMQRLSRDYPQVKIVILSGYSDFKYLNMSIRNHVAEYLLKPTDVDDFEETFRRLKASMDHERLRRAQITESVLRHFHAWLSALLGGVATPRGHRPLSAHADRGGHRPGQPADRGVRPGRPRRGRALRPGGPLAQGVGNRGRPAAGPVPPAALFAERGGPGGPLQQRGRDRPR